MGLNFVAIDFETANSNRGSACSVGMVRVRNGKVEAQESFLIKPHRSLGDFGQFQMNMHKITPEHVADAPDWTNALPRITEFIQQDLVVAHNAPFDFSVITKASEASGIDHPHMRYFCTLDLVRSAIPSLPDHKLKTVAKALKLDGFRHHDAEQDAFVAAMICVIVAEKAGVETLESLMRGYNVNVSSIGRIQESTAKTPNRANSVDLNEAVSILGSSTVVKRESPEMPMTRRERREMEQREAELVGKQEIASPIQVPASEKPIGVKEVFPSPTPQPHTRSETDDTRRLYGEPLVATSTVVQPPHQLPNNGHFPPHPQLTTQRGTGYIEGTTPESWQNQTGVRQVAPAKIRISGKIFLAPIAPFILFVVFMSTNHHAVGAFFMLLWLASILTVTILYLVVRPKRSSKLSQSQPSIQAKDYSVHASARVEPFLAPASFAPQQTITMFNARRVAAEAIAYATALEREVKSANHRVSNMQSVFDRHNMGDIVRLEKTRDMLKATVHSLTEQELSKRAEVSETQKVLDGVRLEVLYEEVGLINYEHVAESSVKLGSQLAEVRKAIKDMVRYRSAYTYASDFYFDDSWEQGRQFSERMAKTMLAAYNAESENAIKSIRGADGASAAKAKIDKSLERIAANGEMIDLKITPEYHALRLREVDLAARHLLSVRLERELEKERREELREQARAAKELQVEHDRLAKERQHYLNTLIAVTAKGDKDAIARMQEKLEEIDDAIENVDSRAANTRAGHVYIISNIGAFGEGIVKIGMTRRLEPMDRVKELGDASVPFRFDTHALFFAEDAVGVENLLHKHFASQRVNRVNLRREFFYTTPHAVLEVLKEHNVEVVEFKEDFQAEEYRVSQEIIAAERL